MLLLEFVLSIDLHDPSRHHLLKVTPGRPNSILQAYGVLGPNSNEAAEYSCIATGSQALQSPSDINQWPVVISWVLMAADKSQAPSIFPKGLHPRDKFQAHG